MENVGGQALIEGVLMRGPKRSAICVRDSKGELVTKVFDNKRRIDWIKKIPLLRGVYALIDSMVMGIQALNYSAQFFIADEEETGFDRFLRKIFGKHAESVAIGLTMLISFMLAVFLFTILPTVIVNFLKNYLTSGWLSFVEAVIKVTVFLTYIGMISRLKDVRRVFQYHGAEHKSIFNYESGLELSVENAKAQPRLHPRCGTSFLFYVLAISIGVFSFVTWDSLIVRIALKIALLPVIAGISYEFIKLSRFKMLRPLSVPGLYLQKITTQEPDEKQLEVAITALKASLGMEISTPLVDENPAAE
ncbi:MAG: DUF1385 domain-containing protein [Bacillota bacterium]|nr:DUF1385 domain-containing protein [Bacillota bacterium]